MIRSVLYHPILSHHPVSEWASVSAWASVSEWASVAASHHPRMAPAVAATCWRQQGLMEARPT